MEYIGNHSHPLLVQLATAFTDLFFWTFQEMIICWLRKKFIQQDPFFYYLDQQMHDILTLKSVSLLLIYCAFIGLHNKLYKIHSTYVVGQ